MNMHSEETGGAFMKILIYAMIAFCVWAVLAGFGGASTGQRNPCYADAQSQLSSQWRGAGVIDRAVVAVDVVTTCEGSK